MNSMIRVVVCLCLLLALATQLLPQSPKQKEAAAPGPQAAAASPSPSPAPSPGPGGTSSPNANPFPSTYKPFPGRTTLIRNATIMTAAGPSIANGSVLLRDGKIAAVGAAGTGAADAVGIDGTRRHGFRPKAIAASGTRGMQRTKVIRRRAIWDWKLWQRCCAATSWSTTIVIALMRWRR